MIEELYIKKQIGNQINASRTEHPRWNDSLDPAIYGTDALNFSAYPAGHYQPNTTNGVGNFIILKGIGLNLVLITNEDYVTLGSDSIYEGGSVRLVKNCTEQELLLADGTITQNAHTDFDGNVYSSTKIGNQIWLRENYKSTKCMKYHYFNTAVVYLSSIGKHVCDTPPPGTPIEDYDFRNIMVGGVLLYDGEIYELTNKYVSDGLDIIETSPELPTTPISLTGIIYRGPYSEIQTNLSDYDWLNTVNPAYEIAHTPLDELANDYDMKSAYGLLYNTHSTTKGFTIADTIYDFRVPVEADFWALLNHVTNNNPSTGSIAALKGIYQVNSPYIINENIVHKADIEKVSITRKYSSPFFSDVTQIKNNGTYTVKLPDTENNRLIFGHCNMLDSMAEQPYEILKADYYFEGINIFLNADVIVLNSIGGFEVQFTWGVIKEAIEPMLTDKLNEIKPNGTTILESDWIANWFVDDMFVSGKKYKYVDYISREKTSDVWIKDGVVQPQIQTPLFFQPHEKPMSMHPFIPFESIIGLMEVSDNLTNIKSRLNRKGLILGGEDDNYSIKSIKDASFASNVDIYLIPFMSDTTYSLIGQVYFSEIINNLSYLDSIKFNIKIDFTTNMLYSFNVDFGIYRLKYVNSVEEYELVSLLTKENRGGYMGLVCTTDITLEKFSENSTDYSCAVIRRTDGQPIPVTPYEQTGTSTLKLEKSKALYGIKNSSYPDSIKIGRYNCLCNLPKMTKIEFLKQLCILTGIYLGADSDGNIKEFLFENIKSNIDNGVYYDWSKRVSNVRKSIYRFNGNAKHNYIKYNNNDKLTYNSKADIEVLDKTLSTERDLYKVDFDLPEQNNTLKAEYILYKQKVENKEIDNDLEVSFSSDYDEKDTVVANEEYGFLSLRDVLPSDNKLYTTISPLCLNDDISIGTHYDHCTIISVSSNGLTVVISSGFSNILVGDMVLFSIKNGAATILNNITVQSKNTGDNSLLLTGAIPLDSTHIDITNKYPFTYETVIDEWENFGYAPESGDKISKINFNELGLEYTFENLTVSDFNDANGKITISSPILLKGAENTITIEKRSIGFVNKYYGIYKKLVQRPLVIDCDVKLSISESSNIDFEMPIYIQEIGRYCILLELTATNSEELCDAKLLLINQIL